MDTDEYRMAGHEKHEGTQKIQKGGHGPAFAGRQVTRLSRFMREIDPDEVEISLKIGIGDY